MDTYFKNLTRTLPLFFLAMVLNLENLQAQNQETGAYQTSSDSEYIIKENFISPELPYTQRREDFSWLLGADLEKFYPKSLESLIDEDVVYSDVFGRKDIDLAQISFGYKKNFTPISLSLNLSLAYGQVFETLDGESYDAAVQMYKLGASVFFDGVLDEPYMVPYISGHLTRFIVSEGIVDVAGNRFSTSKSNNFSPGYTLGSLFQLNWLEKNAATESYVETGLENCYVNLFFAQYFKSGDSSDINMAAGLNWGLGLLLEY